VTTGDSPIFVVGASRSGTNLVRALVNAHSGIWMSAETHYFDDLRQRLGRERLEGRERDVCERYFLSLAHLAYGRGGDPSRAKIDAGELRALAARLGGTGDAYFEAFCLLRARSHGRERWAEKTPRHAFRVAEMLGAFPSAKIVCLVRDPRAVVASYRDWHRGAARDGLDPEDEAGLAAERTRSKRSYHPILASLMWRGVIRAEYDARQRFGGERIRLERFEDLVATPDPSVRALCEWLELEFEPQMLEIPVVNSSYAGSSAPEAIDRWRAKLPPRELAAVERCCGELMAELGYSRELPPMSAAAYAAAWLTVPYATARAALANRWRLGNALEYVRRRGTLAFSKGSLPR
jgi:Sulfotransferase family